MPKRERLQQQKQKDYKNWEKKERVLAIKTGMKDDKNKNRKMAITKTDRKKQVFWQKKRNK